jgi:hypothetical protein
MLMALYFHPWLSAGILISAAILYTGTQSTPAELTADPSGLGGPGVAW